MGGGVREIKKKKLPKNIRAKMCTDFKALPFFLITMQHYKSKAVIKMSLTAMPKAVYTYSNITRQSKRNLEDKVRQ